MPLTVRTWLKFDFAQMRVYEVTGQNVNHSSFAGYVSMSVYQRHCAHAKSTQTSCAGSIIFLLY